MKFLPMKYVLIVGVILIISLVVLSSFTGIGIKSIFRSSDPEDILRDRIRELTEENKQLKSRNEKYILENTNLKAEIQGLVASQAGGMATEERRKGLVEREAELDRREKWLTSREETIRLAEQKVVKQQHEFYEKTDLKLEEIGEAKQIKKDYEYMKTRLEDSEEIVNDSLKLVNRWLIGIAGGIFGLAAVLIYTAT